MVQVGDLYFESCRGYDSFFFASLTIVFLQTIGWENDTWP